MVMQTFKDYPKHLVNLFFLFIVTGSKALLTGGKFS